MLVNEISHMLTDSVELSQNLCEAIVVVLRESILAALSKILVVVLDADPAAADPAVAVEGADLVTTVLPYNHGRLKVLLRILFLLLLFQLFLIISTPTSVRW